MPKLRRKGECGCTVCREGVMLYTKAQWKSRTNKHGRILGSHCQGTHKRGRFKGR